MGNAAKKRKRLASLIIYQHVIFILLGTFRENLWDGTINMGEVNMGEKEVVNDENQIQMVFNKVVLFGSLACFNEFMRSNSR